jgi:hypothetical protein
MTKDNKDNKDKLDPIQAVGKVHEMPDPDDIIQELAGLEPDAQDAILQVCAMLIDCFKEGSEKSAVIVTQDGVSFGIAMVNKGDIGAGVEMLTEATTSFKEALMAGAPPKEMWN